jgi:hypothetical protein
VSEPLGFGHTTCSPAAVISIGTRTASASLLSLGWRCPAVVLLARCCHHVRDVWLARDASVVVHCLLCERECECRLKSGGFLQHLLLLLWPVLAAIDGILWAPTHPLITLTLSPPTSLRVDVPAGDARRHQACWSVWRSVGTQRGAVRTMPLWRRLHGILSFSR